MRLSVVNALSIITLAAMACSCSNAPLSNKEEPKATKEPSADIPPVSGKKEGVPEAEKKRSWTPMASADYPNPPKGMLADMPATMPVKDYLALAWNDLGMHCYQPDFSRLLILPPYNVYWAQVIARGEKPKVVTDGLKVRYKTLNVTDPASHTNFWDYAATHGWKLKPGVGLKGKRTSGQMEAVKDHFVAEGVPVVDFNDDGTWDPFPMFMVSVEDAAGIRIKSMPLT
ncbi:MAG: hypothetical protein U9N87_05415, partial [Planctomycetota bacterium]|nr:hypothetical protein [Planctomycetota bacterium]